MSNLSSNDVEIFEYCIVEETVKLPVDSIKVSIPKLTAHTSSGYQHPKSTILINDSECKPKVTGSVILSNTLTIKTFSNLKESKSVEKVLVNNQCEHNIDCCNIYDYYIRKGTRMIACFMDKNINDGYLTNFI